MGETNILPELKEMGYGEDEAYPIFISITAGWSTRNISPVETEYTFENKQARVQLTSTSKLSKIMLDAKFWNRTKKSLSEEQNLMIYRVARTVMFSNKRLNGYIKVYDWLQIRPVPYALDDDGHYFSNGNALFYPEPFIIEVAYKWSDLVFLESHRKLKAVNEAKWLLSAFVSFPAYQLREPHTWLQQNDGSYRLVNGGMNTGFEGTSDIAFSDVGNLQKLPFEVTEQYIDQSHQSQKFSVPNLEALYSKFKALDVENTKRFVRACAYLFTTTNPNVERSQRIASYVNSVECLIQGKDEDRGSQYKQFIDDFVKPSSSTLHHYKDIYNWRSDIVHGSWHLQVDEPMFGWTDESHIMSVVSLNAAKKGIINWLLAQP